MVITLFVPMVLLAQSADYNKAIAQARADLAAGHNAEALAGSQKAIQIDASRWEAYLIAGSALQTQKQFDVAMDNYTKALERAPESRKAGVRNVLEQCVREKSTAASSPAVSASATGAQSENQASPIPPTAQVTDQQGPSYKDSVKWIQDNIKLAGTPASSKRNETNYSAEEDSSEGKSFAVVVDGCRSLLVTSTESTHQGVTYSNGSAPQNYSNTETIRFKIPFASILGFTVYNKISHQVGITIKDGEASYSANDTGSVTSSSTPETPMTTKNVSPLAYYYGIQVPAVFIPYEKVGAEDAVPHMNTALQHLVDVCKNHPEDAPKSLF
jgi:hypothetical protein